MKAVLLAAGLGTRLRPLTDTIPKCLVPIDGRPLLEIWLENLTRAGIGPFLINTHYLADRVAHFIDQSPYRGDVVLVYEPTLLGTGGTLLKNREFYGRTPVLLAHADNLCRCDFEAFRDAHEARSAGMMITMMTFVTGSPQSCGIIEVDDRSVVTGFHEKVANAPGTRANAAVYILEPEVIDYIASLNSPFVDFSTQVIPHFLGRMLAWHNTGVHIDIGTMASWQAAQTATPG